MTTQVSSERSVQGNSPKSDSVHFCATITFHQLNFPGRVSLVRSMKFVYTAPIGGVGGRSLIRKIYIYKNDLTIEEIS